MDIAAAKPSGNNPGPGPESVGGAQRALGQAHHLRDDAGLAGRTGELHRPRGHRFDLFVGRAVQLDGEDRVQKRTLGSAGPHRDRAAQNLDPLVVDRPEPADVAAIVGQRRAYEKIVEVKFDREMAGFQQRLAVSGVAGLALSGSEPDKDLAPLCHVFGREQGQRLPEPGARVVGSQARQRVVAGPAGVLGGLVPVTWRDGMNPVMGDLGGPHGRVGELPLQSHRDRLVGERAQSGAQFGVQRVGHDRMREREPAGRVDDQRVVHRRCEPFEGTHRIFAEELAEQPEVELPADDRRGVQCLARVRPEQLNAPAHHLPDADRQTLTTQMGR
ncbi:hypothetical protein [Actinoplanes sp. NPDC026670]|uniref:hypothetical protein n=1 Tax=Actinoplanes sp. NPDC026670 TaxID=3154700 RepID=UPI0033E5CF8E